MKVVLQPCFVWAIAVLGTMCDGGPSEAQHVVELVDPLQPVWDSLDRVPQQVSDAVIAAVRTQLSTLSRSIETKIQQLNNTMSAVVNSAQDFINLRNEQQNSPNLMSMMIQHFLLNHLNSMETKLTRHINNQMEELEAKITAHINSKFSETRGGEEPCAASTATLANMESHILKITENLGSISEGGDTCGTLVDKVSEVMNSAASKPKECPNPGVATAAGLVRDCSDKHWMELTAGSGVYEIFPTLDPTAPVSAYCDMGHYGVKENGGWTVILRRRNSTFGLEDFNRTWAEYRKGFGDPGEGEWWLGLAHLHALTYRQPFEVDLTLHDIEKGTYHAQYKTFRIEDEAHNFKLVLGGFKGNLTHDALINKHHGSPFSTYDKDNDLWESGNCAQSNSGGWWFNNCHFTTLTAPFPTSNDRSMKTIRWLEDDWLVLDDVIMKIRPTNYAERFNVHNKN